MKLALIPARAGSKRLPGKNLLPLGGKPLIAHTIEAVIESKSFSTIIVSSDDQGVLDVAREYPQTEPLRRPDHLASDTATTAQVLSDVLKLFRVQQGICGIFLPTSPFRNSRHIVNAMKLLKSDIDCVISVTQYSAPIAFRMHFMNDQSPQLKISADSLLKQGKTRIQEHKLYVYPNGAIYISNVGFFMEKKSFFQGHVAGFLMDMLESLDIDTREDYEYAKALNNVM